MANFGRNIPAEISGPPPEVIQNVPVGRNRNRPFHLNSDRNFQNLWHNGNHPLLPLEMRKVSSDRTVILRPKLCHQSSVMSYSTNN